MAGRRGQGGKEEEEEEEEQVRRGWPCGVRPLVTSPPPHHTPQLLTPSRPPPHSPNPHHMAHSTTHVPPPRHPHSMALDTAMPIIHCLYYSLQHRAGATGSVIRDVVVDTPSS